MNRVDEIQAKVARRERARELVMKHNGEDALTDLYRDSNADITFLLTEINRQAEALKKSRERCWSLCLPTNFTVACSNMLQNATRAALHAPSTNASYIPIAKVR